MPGSRIFKKIDFIIPQGAEKNLNQRLNGGIR
jgi:hypothetical protein